MRKSFSSSDDDIVKKTKQCLIDKIIMAQMDDSRLDTSKQHVQQNLVDQDYISVLLIYIHDSSMPQQSDLSVQNLIKQNNYLCDLQFTKNYKCFQSQDFIFTPEIQVFSFGKKRLKYKIIEMQSSSSVSISLFQEVGTLIESNYYEFQGFLIVGQPDIIVYLGNALSFMLENLDKTVVITASKFPLTQLRNDMIQNVISSLIIAGIYLIPEVIIVIQDKIFRANRCISYNLKSFDFIKSQHEKPLGVLSTKIQIDWDKIMPIDKDKKFSFFRDMDDSVISLRFGPFMSHEYVESIFNSKYKALIIQSDYNGRIPLEQYNLNNLIQKAIDNKKILVNISQHYNDAISPEITEQYNQLGILSCYDMTYFAVQTKLSYLIGKYSSQTQVNKVKKLFKKSIRGELVKTNQKQMFKINDKDIIQDLNSCFQYNSPQNQKLIQMIIIPNIKCHLIAKNMNDFLQNINQDGNQTIKYNKDYDERTPLHIAACYNNITAAQFLISQENTEINSIDRYGRSPLYEAVINRNKNMCYLLKSNGGKVIGSKSDLTISLVKSAKIGDLEFLKMIYHAGLSNLEDFVTYDNRNIAHIAACEGQVQIIQFLINEVFFDFGLKDIYGNTPYDDSVHFKNQQIVELLSS